MKDEKGARKEGSSREHKDPGNRTPATVQTMTITPENEVVPYRIVGVEDNSICGRKRTSVKVVLEDKNAKPEQVHSTLLKVVRGYGGDAVFVFGYWFGDDWRGMYTAGRLEWGKDGKG